MSLHTDVTWSETRKRLAGRNKQRCSRSGLTRRVLKYSSAEEAGQAVVQVIRVLGIKGIVGVGVALGELAAADQTGQVVFEHVQDGGMPLINCEPLPFSQFAHGHALQSRCDLVGGQVQNLRDLIAQFGGELLVCPDDAAFLLIGRYGFRLGGDRVLSAVCAA